MRIHPVISVAQLEPSTGTEMSIWAWSPRDSASCPCAAWNWSFDERKEEHRPIRAAREADYTIDMTVALHLPLANRCWNELILDDRVLNLNEVDNHNRDGLMRHCNTSRPFEFSKWPLINITGSLWVRTRATLVLVVFWYPDFALYGTISPDPFNYSTKSALFLYNLKFLSDAIFPMTRPRMSYEA